MMKEIEQIKEGTEIEGTSFTKTCIDRGLFTAIIDILGELTGEKKRRKVTAAIAEVREDEDWDDVEDL